MRISIQRRMAPKTTRSARYSFSGQLANLGKVQSVRVRLIYLNNLNKNNRKPFDVMHVTKTCLTNYKINIYLLNNMCMVVPSKHCGSIL